MTRIRLILLSMLAVFAVSAAAASTASAHRVWTLGSGTTPLPVGTTKALKVIKVNKAFELKVPLAGETIVCKAVVLKEGTIENVEIGGKKTGRDKGIVEFSECKNKGKEKCIVAEPIRVPPKGTGTTVLAENTAKTKVLDVFLPEGGEEGSVVLKPYATIKQSGTGCTAPAATTVEGNGVAAEISPETHSVKKNLIFPCPRITEVIFWKNWEAGTHTKLTLNAFAFAAEECGEAEIELTTKEEFGVV
jgi:hypothetical protein